MIVTLVTFTLFQMSEYDHDIEDDSDFSDLFSSMTLTVKMIVTLVTFTLFQMNEYDSNSEDDRDFSDLFSILDESVGLRQ